jgi:hypothetical protein
MNNLKLEEEGALGCSSVVECLPSVCECLIPSTEKEKREEEEEELEEEEEEGN